MNDESIIALFNERSEQAITSLSERFGTSLLAVAENLLGNKEDAEECVQDTFLAVWNRIPPEQPTSLSAYVFRILRNIAIRFETVGLTTYCCYSSKASKQSPSSSRYSSSAL